MKNRKRFAAIPLAIVVIALALGTLACKDELPPVAQANLTGKPVIPAAVVLGHEVTANVNALSGTGEISYKWEHSSTANGEFTPIEPNGTSRTFQVVYQQFVVEAGRYIRVTVTREGLAGSASSNAAEIYDESNVTINSVTINKPTTITNDQVETGKKYTFTATVANSVGTNVFQEVNWSVTGNSSATTVISADGELSVAYDEDEDGELTITATSKYNNNQYDYVVLTVAQGEGPPDGTLTLELASFLAGHDDSSNFRDTANAQSGTEDGWYFMKSSKTTIGNGSYEISLTLAAPVDITPYQYMTFDMKADAANVLTDIEGFYPRFRNSAGNFVQYARSNSADNDQGGGASAWTMYGDWDRFRVAATSGPTTVRPLGFLIVNGSSSNSILPGRPQANPHEVSPFGGNVESIKEAISVIVLRFICTSTTVFDSKVYFRNFQLHMERPGEPPLPVAP